MQYTTQQLQGGPKYSHKTRIGNWTEDMELNRVQGDNYRAKKAGETLPFARTLGKYQQSYRQVPWSYAADGNLRWNDQIMLQNLKTQGWLVVDVGDRTPNMPESYTVTSTGEGQNPGPMTRSVFQLRRVDDMDVFGADEFIRYGQKVRIVSNEYLYRKPLALSSFKQTATICSPVSNKQLTCMSSNNQAYDGVWVIDAIDPVFRFEKQGELVPANAPILLRHVQTCVYLGSCPTNKYKNDFGAEHEVYCFNHSTLNRSQNLALEKDGRMTSDVPSKFQDEQNHFLVVTAPDASLARPITDLQAFDMSTFIKDVKQKIFDRSNFGIRALKRIFQAMDERGDKKLDVDDFRWGLIDYGISMTKEESQEVLKAFDRDGNGYVDFDEFLVTLRGALNDSRKAVVARAYKKLDVNGDGTVRLDDIAKLYDASQHPEVVSGKKSEQDVYLEFMGLWDTQVKDGVVTLDEFQQYYEDISASVDTDDEFAFILKQAWKLEDE